MNERATVLIADDHQLFLDGLKLILRKKPDITIAAEALNGAQLLKILGEQPIDLVITDLGMPGMKGIELVKQIKQGYPAVKLIVLTMHSEQEIISEILQAEAEGYLLKNSGRDTVLKAVSDVLSGKTHYDDEVIELFLKRARKEKREEEKLKPLTERERQVLQLIVQELTSKEIAERLFISKQTVDTHRLNLLHKTGAKSVVGLIRYAVQAGML